MFCPSRSSHRPDVVLMDVDMPGTDGLSATASLLERLPATRVLIVTTFGRPGFLRRAIQSGAHGFVVKDAPATELAESVRRVHAGLRVVDPALAADSLIFGDSPLTARETEVLQAAADGATVSEVARRVHLSEGTTRNHRSQAMAKTGAPTRAAAVRHRRTEGVDHRVALGRRFAGSAQQRVDEALRVEGGQVVGALPQAHELDGHAQLLWTVTTMPPLAVPSSLVSTMPVTPTASEKTWA